MGAIIVLLKTVPLRIWLIGAGLILLMSWFGYQMYQLEVTRRQLEVERKERERLERKTEGLQILVNTANIAQEVEKLKEKANVQANNSKNANGAFGNVVNRNANSYANDFTNAKRKYCETFNDPSICS